MLKSTAHVAAEHFPIFARTTILFFIFSTFVFGGQLWSQAASEDQEQINAQTRAIAKKLLSEVRPGQQEVNLGCIRLHVEQLEAISSDQKAGFVMEIDTPPFTNRWPDGIVYYAFNPPGIEDGTIDALGRTAVGRKELVREAMDEWESAAQLTFIEVPLDNPGVDNYIIIQDNADGNNSLLGKNPFLGSQTLNMVSWGYPQTKGIIIHELGHALGLYHEQSRSDRDSFVEIRNENIDDEFEDQFATFNTLNIGDYDFESIMHYRRCAFSINGLDTIVMKPGFEQFQNVIGQRNGLSDSDREGMAGVYGALSPTSTPGISPPPGNYDNPIQVMLVVNAVVDGGDTRYFYTLDGSDPTTNSNEYFLGEAIPLNSNTTVKYFALKAQHSPSTINTVNYTFTNPTPMVATPVFNPPSGTYGPGTMVSVSTSTPDADIFLSFGPTQPSQSGFQYTAPIPLNTSTQINAKAFKAGHTPSGVATANYEIQENKLEPPPGFFPDPTAQEYAGPLNVFLVNNSTIIGTEMRYTIDGTEPNNTTSPIFDQTPIILNQDTTVKAKLFREGFTPSDTSTANYNIVAAADVPIIDPNGGNSTGTVDVSLSLPTKSSIKGGSTLADFIYYTTNGADPQEFSTLYDGPFTLGVGNHTVKARTIFPGLPPSAIAQAQFTVFTAEPTLDPPTFKPVARDHANSVEITIEHFTEGAQIRYTVGDNEQPADPTAASTLYAGPFTLGLPTAGGDFWFVKSKAFKDAEESGITGKTYSVFTPLGDINPPTFDPPGGGPFDNPITVEMSATTDPPTTGIQIFRTTNGDPAIVPDPPVGGTNLDVNINGDTQLNAIAYRNFFGESEMASASYTFKCASPTITALGSKTINHIGSVTIVMDSTTTGGNTTIRYATGGLEPTIESTQYSDPIELGIGTHIFKAKTFRNNFADSETATASFIVTETPEAPVFLTQPMSATVDQFTDHTFIAEATGVPEPEYSWFFQSLSATQAVRLAGETEASLTIFNVQVANAGNYTVVASNSAGSVTSEIAVLTVIEVDPPTPTVTSTPSETPTGTPPTATPSATPTLDGGMATETPTPTMMVAQKAILGASQDNTLIEDASGERSNALSQYFFAGRTSQEAGLAVRRGLIAFDIVGSVSAGSTVTAVTLTLNMSIDIAPQDFPVTLHRVAADWGEGTSVPEKPEGGIGGAATEGDATWLHRFYDDVFWNDPGGDFEETASATTTVAGPAPYSWGSNAQMVMDVQSWLDDPSSNYGWLLKGDEETSGAAKRFDSKENLTESNRPVLCVEYLPAATEEATPTPTLEGPTFTPTNTLTDSTPTPTEPPVTMEDVDTNNDNVIDAKDLLNVLRFWQETMN